jgi:hypothetical protein
LGNVLLQPAGTANQALASISGQITANMGPTTNFGGYKHIVVSALQSIMRGNSPVFATNPLASQYSSTLRIFVTGSNSYQLEVGAANPRVGAFVPNGIMTFQQDTSSPPTYQVETQSSCNPAAVQTQSGIGVLPVADATAPLLALTGCPLHKRLELFEPRWNRPSLFAKVIHSYQTHGLTLHRSLGA